MSNFRRRLMMSIKKSKLPSGYIELEYLESTGTQYIDTLFIPNQDTRVILDYNQKISEKGNVIMGTRASTTPTLAYIFWGASSGYWRIQYNGQNFLSAIKKDNKRHLLDFNKNNVYFDETLIKTFIYETFTCNHSIPIFCCYDTNKYDYFQNAKIYSCKIYDNDVLVRDFIPCLDNNGTPCMYDMVSKQTFYNQGTGEFKWSINPTYLSLNMFVDGFVNSSTGTVAPNSTYPRAISSPLVLFEKGKTYKLTTDLSATKIDDGVRFRIYGTDDTYKMNLGASQITTNAYATFEALDDAGKANLYVAKDILITPKQDFKARIMYLDSNYISDFKIEGLE